MRGDGKRNYLVDRKRVGEIVCPTITTQKKRVQSDTFDATPSEACTAHNNSDNSNGVSC